MKELFSLIDSRLSAGQDTILAIIIEKKGSAPRGAGAWMAIGREGRLLGSIGGGAMEDRAIKEGRSWPEEKQFGIISYSLIPGDAAGLGMVCGGNAKVLFYAFRAGNRQDMALVKQAGELSEAKEPAALLFPAKEEARAKILTDHDISFCETMSCGLIEIDGGVWFAKPLGGAGTVYIFGGGHLAQELVPVLSHLDFSCIVMDDREEFLKPELFSGAREVKKVDFKHLDERLTITAQDYLAVMTRGHLSDAEVERFALRTPAAYIGVVGSARKINFIRGELMKDGFTEEDLNRVTTPIGLDIGSDTPAEIAISIAAQLIQVRAGRRKQK